MEHDTKMRAQPIRVPGGRIVATVTGDTLEKSIVGSKHILRRPPAIAFDVSVLNDARKLGAKNVIVLDRETGDVYRTEMDDIFFRGIKLNRGFGEQLALTLNQWKLSKAGEHPQEDAPE